MSQDTHIKAKTADPPQQKSIVNYLPVVIACAMWTFCPVAIQASCLGLFYKDIAGTYGVAVSQISLFLTIGLFLAAIILPFVGKWLKQYDARIITTIHVFILGFGVLFMAYSPSIIGIWIAGALIVAACGSMGVIKVTLIQRWFHEGARTIVGLVAACSGLGGIVFSLLGGGMQEALGYQATLVVYSALIFILCLPLSIFAARSYPEERGLTPFVLKSKRGKIDRKKKEDTYWTVDPSKATRSLAFVLVVLCSAIASSTNMTYRFFPTYLATCADAGIMIAVTSSVFISIVSFTQMFTKPLLGFICDVLTPFRGIVGASICGMIGYFLIMVAPGNIGLIIGACMYAVFLPCVAVLVPVLAGAVFGMGDNYSIMYSRALSPARILAAPAATLWPLMAEYLGGWSAVFITDIVLIGLFAILSGIAIKQGKLLPRAEQEHATSLNKKQQEKASITEPSPAL